MAWRRIGDKPLSEQNADTTLWRIYASLGGDEITRQLEEYLVIVRQANVTTVWKTLRMTKTFLEYPPCGISHKKMPSCVFYMTSYHKKSKIQTSNGPHMPYVLKFSFHICNLLVILDFQTCAMPIYWPTQCSHRPSAKILPLKRYLCLPNKVPNKYKKVFSTQLKKVT